MSLVEAKINQKRKFNRSSKLHICLSIFWVVMLIPTLLWWKESVLWVAILSLYALFVGHISSFEASNNASVDRATHVKLDAIADGLADLMVAIQHSLSDQDEAKDLLKDIKELRSAVGIEERNL